jgi:hypothetical protein
VSKFFKCSILSFFLFISEVSIAQYFNVGPSYLTMGNDSLELKFQKWDGEIYSFYDKKKNIEFIREKNTNWSLFNLRAIINGNSNVLGGWVGNGFTYDVLTKSNSLVLNLHWTSFNNGGIINMGVNISIEIEKFQPTTTWGIEIINPLHYPIENIQIPSWYGVDKLSADPEKDFIAYPKWGGILIKNPITTLKTEQGLAGDLEYPSASNNMQFMAYYSTASNSGLYMSTDDSSGQRKLFNVNKFAPNNLQVYINHTPVYSNLDTAKLPYRIQVGLFNGGWYDAAMKYKNAVRNAPWLAKGKISNRTDIPQWYKDVSYHSWFYTHPPGAPAANPFSMVPQVARELNTYFQVPGVVDWVGWENGGWYIKYPDAYPPNKGWASFRNTMKSLDDSNFHVMSVSNTNSYSSIATTFSTAQNSIVKQRNNTPYPPHDYSEGSLTTSLYQMCPSTTFWKNKVTKLIDTLMLESMDVVQIDGFPLNVPVCYDNSHGHPIGGGNWWYTAYNDLYKSIRDKARLNNGKTTFSTEAMSEVYIPQFDSYWDPYTTGVAPCQLAFDSCSKVELIPLWQTVYHEYILMQSGISFFTPSPGEEDFYRRGFGLALIWGEVPTTFSVKRINDINSSEAKVLAYMKQIVLARSTYAKEFLVYGEMQRKLELNVPTFFNAGANSIPYNGGAYAPFYCPSVLTSSWKSQAGLPGHIFTNISNSIVPFSCVLPDYNYGGASFDIIQMINGKYSILQRNITLPFNENLNLSPNDVLILKAVPASGNHIWIGTVSTDWHNATNWSPAIVPTIDDDVIVPFGTPFKPAIAVGATGSCKTITVEQAAKINVASSGNLKVGL